MRILRRAVALLLAAILAWGCVACAEGGAGASDRRLVIEEVQRTYTTDFLDALARDLTAVLEKWVRVARGMQLSEAERTALNARVREDVIPILCGVSISNEEAERLLERAREYCAALESGEGVFGTARFYSAMVALLGISRAGEVARRGTAVYLSHNIALCEERYRTYGYAWYLEDAERYRELASALEGELTARDFAAAMSVLALADLADSRTGTGGWPSGILLGVWQWQAAHMDALALTAEKWELIGALLADVQPQKRDTALRAELDILQEEGRIAALFGAMPALLRLYSAIVARLDSAALDTLREGELDEVTATLCRAAISSEEELNALLARIGTFASDASEAEKKAMRSLGLEADVQAFLADTATLSADALCDVLRSCAEDGDAKVLWTAQIGFLRGVMPYLAYAMQKGE